MAVSYTHLVAVRSERPVRLIFCRAEAEGAAVLSTGEVILDGSRVSPELPGARTIQRTAVPAHRIRENGLCAAMGTDRAGVEELWKDSLGGRAQFYAYDTAEREPAQLFSVPMAPVSFPETLSGDYEAVSYTHLDVYKRQYPGCGRPRRNHSPTHW